MEGLNPVYTMFLKIFLESVTKIKIYFWMCSMLLFSHFYFKIYFGAGNFAWDRVLLSYLLLDTQITGKHILRRSHRVREWEVGEITFLPMLGNFNSWARLTCFPWAPPESSTSFQKDVYFCVYVCMCVLFSHQVVSNSSRPHGLQHARLPCPSPSPGVCPSSCPLNQWCHNAEVR